MPLPSPGRASAACAASPLLRQRDGLTAAAAGNHPAGRRRLAVERALACDLGRALSRRMAATQGQEAGAPAGQRERRAGPGHAGFRRRAVRSACRLADPDPHGTGRTRGNGASAAGVPAGSLCGSAASLVMGDDCAVSVLGFPVQPLDCPGLASYAGFRPGRAFGSRGPVPVLCITQVRVRLGPEETIRRRSGGGRWTDRDKAARWIPGPAAQEVLPGQVGKRPA